MTELMPYLRGQHDSLVNAAQQVHQCFQPYSADAQDYAIAVANSSATCRKETGELWQYVSRLTGGATAMTEPEFVMQQNALVALNGERYYSAMVSSNTESWNIRDRHMAQTLKRLMEFHGAESKAIIWEHNTHVGDARYTDMAAEGTVNVGQLVRDEYGRNNVFIVGTGSYQGSVIAADEWGAPMKSMNVPAAINGSWEQLLHQLGADNKLILSNEIRDVKFLQKPIGHRAIGVVYDPKREQGNYVPSVIPDRYDAFLYIDQSRALHPLNIKQQNDPPDTYPSGY
jgi:erythromycin esterase-like protein